MSYARSRSRSVKFATIFRGRLEAAREATYTKAVFGSEDVTPVRSRADLYLLGCPTALRSLKDLALQLLRQSFGIRAREARRAAEHPGATSGTRGVGGVRAARQENIRVFMLSPHGRMSAFQAAQMYSLQDANIHNIAVRGVFDECRHRQGDLGGSAFKARHRIGAVNSINWARVAAQRRILFKAYTV